jgi:thiol-disulfide isomerase/thioredoxin
MKLTFIILLLSISLAMTGQMPSDSGPAAIAGTPKEIVSLDGTTVPIFDFDGFRPNLEHSGDTVYVVNFWATWCKPCIEEIPDFLQLSRELAGENVIFLFVSLDFRKNLEKGVIPFIQSKEMNSNVLLLHDPDADQWIPQVNAQWTGAIPATLIYRGDDRKFFEKTLSYEELKSIIYSLNHP